MIDLFVEWPPRIIRQMQAHSLLGDVEVSRSSAQLFSTLQRVSRHRRCGHLPFVHTRSRTIEISRGAHSKLLTHFTHPTDQGCPPTLLRRAPRGDDRRAPGSEFLPRMAQPLPRVTRRPERPIDRTTGEAFFQKTNVRPQRVNRQRVRVPLQELSV
jgi:hypothetical protein